jgi:hypothetical protein
LAPKQRRCLVLDEDINWKLSRELQKRGMAATSHYKLDLLSKDDSLIIKTLAESHEPCVLVAWDNKLHLNHAAALLHFGLTLAVIDKYADRGDLTEEQYRREVIHRFAHRMAAQEQGDAFKYSRTRSKRLTIRVPKRSIAV